LAEKGDWCGALYQMRRYLVLAPNGPYSGRVRQQLDKIERLTMVFHQMLEPGDNARYAGETIMLIDERTASQAEHSGLFFRAANHTVFIGSPTAGVDGDITTFMAPGGIRITFSGQ